MSGWDQLNGRATVSVEEAADLLGISRSTAYEAARLYEASKGTAGLPVLRFGRRFLVPVPRLRALLGISGLATACGESESEAGP
jgi:excisionase family DNA binding protein